MSDNKANKPSSQGRQPAGSSANAELARKGTHNQCHPSSNAKEIKEAG